MTSEKISEIETELDGLDFAVKDALLCLQVIQKRLQELRVIILKDDNDLDEF